MVGSLEGGMPLKIMSMSFTDGTAMSHRDVEIQRAIIAGWTGRDAAAVEALGIGELRAAQDVPVREEARDAAGRVLRRSAPAPTVRPDSAVCWS